MVVEVVGYFGVWVHCDMQGPGALWGDASCRLGVRLMQDHFVGFVVWVAVCVVVFANGRASFTGLDNVEGWVPVIAVGQDVSMIVPIMGEQGLMLCSEVNEGCSIALRFLESWPKTFVIWYPLLLLYYGRLF